MPNVGPMELIIVLVIALVVFGPKRLPDMGRSIGRGMREFKHGLSGTPEEQAARAAEERQRTREANIRQSAEAAAEQTDDRAA